VILPPAHIISGIDDSKKLGPAVRERFFEIVLQEAVAWAVAMVDATEIDRINIHHASLKAMRLAVLQLTPRPQFLLVDGRFPIPDCSTPQKAVVRGDQLSQSIAAASILAKVSRDRWIIDAGRSYPAYDFKSHKGYGTARHFQEIRKAGLTPLHRRSFNSHS
jgi:ribonuclease HII